MNNEHIVSVNDLRKTYGKIKAVDGVSFNVKWGEVFGVLGPNGAGKTTTLEILEGLTSADSGECEVVGVNVIKSPRKVQPLIGVSLQTTTFLEKLRLSELLQFFGRAYRIDVNPKEVLARMGLENHINSYANKLSGGQRQRFALLVALLNNPKLLFLDEPTTGLDPVARRGVWEQLRELKKSGLTIIMTTHYMEEAQELCDTVAIMDAGKIVALGSPEKMINDLLKGGFKPQRKVYPATLEDVFVNLTGKSLIGDA